MFNLLSNPKIYLIFLVLIYIQRIDEKFHWRAKDKPKRLWSFTKGYTIFSLSTSFILWMDDGAYKTEDHNLYKV